MESYIIHNTVIFTPIFDMLHVNSQIIMNWLDFIASTSGDGI